jgi:hypothetical protein
MISVDYAAFAPLRFTEMAVARERHRARNVTDFSASLDRLSLPRLLFGQVGAMHPPRGGFFVGCFQEAIEPVMNASRLLSQFRISAAMQPYVLRLRLRGTDFEFGSEPEQAVAYTKCVNEMRRILVEKRRVAAIAADRAIKKSRGRIRLSISPFTPALSQDDGGPVPYYS